ncbi:hypothetical protein GEW_13666, partial [Pasteurella multocida subsp. gallicida str. Anand1_poultry]
IHVNANSPLNHAITANVMHTGAAELAENKYLASQLNITPHDNCLFLQYIV